VSTDPATAPATARVSEGVVRRKASAQPVPPFPHESLTKRHSGVSVAEITFSAMGAVTRIDVLEAPDEWIARSMRDTLQKWRLPEARQGGQPIGISAKVTYYFVIEGAIGSSLSNSVNGGLLKTPSGRNQNGASW
jgi:outer membrane biosynthesis protein TonB